jgi:hypothetical protein
MGGASESARSGKAYGAGTADNAWRVVFCDEAGARDRSWAAGREASKNSASPTTADPDRDRGDG